jgi:hypothetical protein
MSLLQTRCLKRSFLVEELYETWKLDHNQAMLAADIEEFGGECRELCQLLHRAWKARNDEFFKTGIGDLGSETEMLDVATEKASVVIRGVLAAAEIAKRNGIAIVVVGPLQKELESLLAIQVKAPRFDMTELIKLSEESRAAYAKGDFRYLDEWLHELKAEGHSSGTDKSCDWTDGVRS